MTHAIHLSLRRTAWGYPALVLEWDAATEAMDAKVCADRALRMALGTWR